MSGSLVPRRLLVPALLACALLVTVACDRERPRPPITTTGSLSQAQIPTQASALPSPRDACPSDMVLSEGLYCPEVDQHCAAPQEQAPSERCQRYAKPSVCLSLERRLLRFCVDRFEWPNRLGQKPLVLVNWDEAQQLCESVGKRLCDEDEWVFACEGEELLPYTYGYERDPTRCVIDRLPSTGPEPKLPRDRCMEDSECKSAFDALDQREPAGTFQRCVSPSGAHDMNGNVAEWVRLNDRAALAGGSWGPERNNCRSTAETKTRDERAYQLGFRCCRNAAP